MKNTLAAFSFALTCCAAGALAQPEATSNSMRKLGDAVNVWGVNPAYKQTFNAESMKSTGLANDKLKSADAPTMESTTRALPESVRKSAQNSVMDSAARITSLRQTEAPGHLNSNAFDAENPLSKRDDVNRR